MKISFNVILCVWRGEGGLNFGWEKGGTQLWLGEGGGGSF